ncbi:MAG: rod-binding protein [Pirellula sp.]|jgi:flagellar protein FlgJ
MDIASLRSLASSPMNDAKARIESTLAQSSQAGALAQFHQSETRPIESDFHSQFQHLMAQNELPRAPATSLEIEARKSAGDGAPMVNRKGPSVGDGDDALEKAFTDFVGQTLFAQVLSSMRSTQKEPAYFHGGQAEKIFQGQLDQILTEEISNASADKIAKPMYELFRLRQSQ